MGKLEKLRVKCQRLLLLNQVTTVVLKRLTTVKVVFIETKPIIFTGIFMIIGLNRGFV